MLGGRVERRSNWALIGVAMLGWLVGCTPSEPAGSPESVAPVDTTAVQSSAAGTDQATNRGAALAESTRGASPKKTTNGNQPSAQSPFRFDTVGAERGLDFVRYEDIRGRCRILESTGGGVAMLDIDADGWLDLMFTDGDVLVTRSEREAGLPDAKLAAIAHGGKLFRNLGDMYFRDITGPCGIRQLGHGQGCAVGDYDGDGFDDLYVAAFGENALWRNNGDGTFSEVTMAAGVEVSSWSTSCAFADLNGDGLLDLYVVNYLVDSADDPILCPAAESPTGYTQCPPSKYDGVDNVFLLNRGDGGFDDVTEASGLKGLLGKSLGVVIGNFDNEGPLEIFVANDGEANFLLVAVSGGTGGELPVYQERGLAHGVALNRSGYAQASMGVAVGDIDGEGLIDIALTHFYGDSNTIYRNLGGLRFDDVTRVTGVLGPSKQVLGWGTVLEDLDLDGDQDLVVVNGHVADREWLPHPEPFGMPAQLFVNQGQGRFSEVSRGAGDYFEKSWKGRGLAVGDLDCDGRVDFAVSNILEPAAILWNRTQVESPAVRFSFVGVDSSRDATGVIAEVLGKNDEILSTRQLVDGEGFQSSSEDAVFFPHLGDADTIRVRWPSGQVDRWAWPGPGNHLIVEQRGIISR